MMRVFHARMLSLNEDLRIKTRAYIMAKRYRVSGILKWVCFGLLLLSAGGLFLFYYQSSYTKNIDPVVYELPFSPGEKHRVVQGYGGLFSHHHAAALDFEMPVGTAVYAARGGIIAAYKDDNTEGGPFASYKRKANYIMILHDDGSFGCYWHLDTNGVLIKNGRVSAGQQIGISGATGQVLRPHLHFSVKSKLNYEMNSFVQTKFRTTNGVLILENGQSYQRP
jgi:murein DD-endopeptidase MepM/ murein hydrolase activator NlpD